jgi:cell division topological specificity factor
MRHMKQDFIHTVKKYARIDEKNVTVWISSDPPVIHAEIPITKNQERA